MSERLVTVALTAKQARELVKEIEWTGALVIRADEDVLLTLRGAYDALQAALAKDNTSATPDGGEG